MIECLDRRDVHFHDRLKEKPKALREELLSRRIGWLALALQAQIDSRELAKRTIARELGLVVQVRTRSEFGGMMFEHLLAVKSGEPDFVLFGVTTSSDEVTNGRLELHFSMLKESLSYIIKGKSDFGQVPASAPMNRSSTDLPVPPALTTDPVGGPSPTAGPARGR